MLTRILGIVTLLALLAGSTLGQAVALKPLKPADEIRGKFTDNKDLPKMKAAGNHTVYTDAKEFAKLWKEWKGDAPLPKIDFKKQFAIAATAQCAANSITGTFGLTEAGDLKNMLKTTLIGGPGFAWVIFVFERAGVKSVNGKPLP